MTIIGIHASREQARPGVALDILGVVVLPHLEETRP
jgi:hypothetical protein